MKIREMKEKSYISINQAKSFVAQVNRDMQKDQKNRRKLNSSIIQNFKSDIEFEMKRNVANHNSRKQHMKDSMVMNKLHNYQGNRDFYSERIKDQIDKANIIDT